MGQAACGWWLSGEGITTPVHPESRTALGVATNGIPPVSFSLAAPSRLDVLKHVVLGENERVGEEKEK